MDAERIKQLKDGLQVLQLSPTLSQDLQGVEITPEEGFLLSRIDGSSRPKDIIAVSPMSESNTESALLSLLEKNLIRLGGVVESPARSASTAKQEPSPSMPGVDEAVVAELDRLLALGRKRDFSALLGVSDKAAESERKRYLFTADAGVGAGQKRPPRLSYSACSGPGGSRFANWANGLNGLRASWVD